MNNHEMAKRYMDKQRLIGREILELRLLCDDRVELIDVKDKDDNGRLVIPSFITEIRNEYKLDGGVLNECMYSEIHIDNNKRLKSINGLCNGVASSGLKVSSSNDGIEYMECLFSNAINARHIDISELKMGSVVDISAMFRNCGVLEEVDLTNLSGRYLKNMDNLFSFCDNIKVIKFNKMLDTSGVESMVNIFTGCDKLESVDVSMFNTSNVTDMRGMFSCCTNLKELNISNFDTSKVEDMTDLFNGCRGLMDIDVSKLSTGKVETMKRMFSGCTNLRCIDISNLDTSNVLDMCSMFSGCVQLEGIKIKGIDTSRVIDISYMFDGCKRLKSLDLSGLNFDNVVWSECMLSDCRELIDLKVSNGVGNRLGI